MTKTYNVAVVLGSLRNDSLSRKAAQALTKLAPGTLELSVVEIGDLPLYNEDLETAQPPQAWTRFREQVAAADAVLFVTPEYNRSVPGVLKNAIDVGSRPYGQAVWASKPAAVMTLSPGALGAFGANHHLRQTLVFFDMPVLQQPEAYIGNAHTLFGEDGTLQDTTQEFFKRFIDAFAELIERQAREPALRQAA